MLDAAPSGLLQLSMLTAAGKKLGTMCILSTLWELCFGRTWFLFEFSCPSSMLQRGVSTSKEEK